MQFRIQNWLRCNIMPPHEIVVLLAAVQLLQSGHAALQRRAVLGGLLLKPVMDARVFS